MYQLHELWRDEVLSVSQYGQTMPSRQDAVRDIPFGKGYRCRNRLCCDSLACKEVVYFQIKCDKLSSRLHQTRIGSLRVHIFEEEISRNFALKVPYNEFGDPRVHLCRPVRSEYTIVEHVEAGGINTDRREREGAALV